MAYGEFKSIALAKKAYKRVRKPREFILDDEYVNKSNLVCAHCKKLLRENIAERGFNGNRCTYYPKNKKVICFHYVCSWKVLLNYIYGPLYEKLMY